MDDKYENWSGSEIGRKFAPEGIKDKAGWGRKLVARAKKAGETVVNRMHAEGLFGAPNTQAEVTQRVIMSMIGTDAFRYRAPHANRPTAQRKVRAAPGKTKRVRTDPTQPTRITIPA